MLIDPHRDAARVITVTFSDTTSIYEIATNIPQNSTQKLVQTCPIIALHFFGLTINQTEKV